MMHVQADHRRAGVDPRGASGEMQSEEERARQVAQVDMRVVLRKPGVFKSKRIRKHDLLRDFLVDLRGRARAGAFNMVGEGKLHGGDSGARAVYLRKVAGETETLGAAER